MCVCVSLAIEAKRARNVCAHSPVSSAVIQVAAPRPVLVRGGGKASIEEVLARTAALMKQGAKGIVYVVFLCAGIGAREETWHEKTRERERERESMLLSLLS